MWFGVVTLFPEMFSAVTGCGVSGRAFRNDIVQLVTASPRDYAENRYGTVDDRPYGGGAGMLMMAGPLKAATERLHEQSAVVVASSRKLKTVYFSPQGRRLTQDMLESESRTDGLVFVCGRYEGVDQRFIESCVDEEWSLGDFVLSGGEFAALAVIDALTRLQPGALGHADSAPNDSFGNGLLEGPQYTRPETFEGRQVPEVLLSGDHARIAAWRRNKSVETTRSRRPDLIGHTKDSVSAPAVESTGAKGEER